MKTQYSILFVAILLSFSFASCTKEEGDNTILYECPECEQDGTIQADDDVLPTLTVPTRQDPKVVVLMYHNLVYGRTGNEFNRDIYNFEQDLAHLRKNFKIIDFYDLEKINSGEMTLTSDAAIITFDDADLSIYPLTFPLLKKYNFKATFFIVSSFVGEVGYATWDHLTEISSYKNKDNVKLFTMGSHTNTHLYLNDQSLDVVRSEVAISKQVISDKLNVPVDFIALPYGSGSENAAIKTIIQEAGYKGIRTSTITAISTYPADMYHIPGFNIENYSNAVFVQKVTELLGR